MLRYFWYVTELKIPKWTVFHLINKFYGKYLHFYRSLIHIDDDWIILGELNDLLAGIGNKKPAQDLDFVFYVYYLKRP